MSTPQYPLLSKAPVQIAVFQIQFSTDVIFPASGDKLDTYVHELSGVFPVFKKNLNRTVELDKLKDVDTSVKVSKGIVDRLTFETKDKSHIMILSENTLLLEIRKYVNWEESLTILKQAWTLYSDLILNNKFNINRASTRFINRIEIVDMADPSEYFNTTMYASDGAIQGVVDSFLMRYVAKLKDIEIQSHITQGFEPPIGNIFPFVFDIDVISVKNLDMEGLWNEFVVLREIKNKTFFSNLTEKTLKLLL